MKKERWHISFKTVILGGLLLGGLVGCGAVMPSILTTKHFPLVLTVQTQSKDTKASLEALYQGEVSVWQPDAGFAILGVDQAPKSNQNVIGLDKNASVLDAPEARQLRTGVGFEGWSVMGSGLSTWAGGWSAWGSGWSVVSSGSSSLPTLPSDNRFAYTQTMIPAAQTLSKNYGSGMKVAVIDTGLDLAHPAFVGHLAPNSEWKDFVDADTNPQEVSGGVGYGHGTGIAGIILQIAPKATILPIRVLDQNGAGDVMNVVGAIDWAILKGANIINLSLGANVDVTALKTEVNYAGSKGVYIITSAGNDGTAPMTYPAEYAKSISNAKYLISVASTTSTSLVSVFSNISPNLELLAPAERIYSAYPGNRVGYFAGTSFAAPQVAGALALLLSDTALANRVNGESYLISSAASISGTSARQINLVSAIQKTPDWKPRKALFVVGNATTLSSSDAAIQSVMQSIGYTVTLKPGNGLGSNDAAGNDLVVISSTITAADVNSTFRDVTVPVLTWESNLYPYMAMVSTTADLGVQSAVTSVNIVNNTHPLSAGIVAATWQVFGAADDMAWGKPSTTATKIATLSSDASKTSIFAYDKGVQMVGLVAPARRVGFMFRDTSESNAATHWLSSFLFKSAVNWAVSGN